MSGIESAGLRRPCAQRRTVICMDKGTDAGLGHTSEAVWDLRAVQSPVTSGYLQQGADAISGMAYTDQRSVNGKQMLVRPSLSSRFIPAYPQLTSSTS